MQIYKKMDAKADETSINQLLVTEQRSWVSDVCSNAVSGWVIQCHGGII